MIAQGLYDPANEHDACGVGFIAHIKGNKSHSIIEQGLQILKNLDHRGAVFAVAQALNKRGGGLFAADDERRFGEFTASLGFVLESWWHMAHLRSAA